MSAITITKENFKQEVMQSDKPVLLDFYATWCGPCKMLAPIIDEISEQNNQIIKVGKVDIEDQAELAKIFNVTNIPSLFVLSEGKVVNNAVGAISKDSILDLVNEYKS